MTDIITATAAGVVGIVAITALKLWAESQRGRVSRGESCVCAPHRDMALTPMRTGSGFASPTVADTGAIDTMLERHRHEMSVAIERERHYSELQRIRNRQLAPQTRLPQPVRRTVPRLPAPSVVEIPGETVTTDGYRWVALEREVTA